MIQTESRPLKQLFNDHDFAWQLLQAQVKLQTNDSVTGEDVSYLLQLYMKGVQKMNSFLDYRQAYFKDKVMTLMSRPTVMKTLNSKNSMSKKNITPIVASEKEKSPSDNLGKTQKSGSSKKIQQIQLKEKKRQIQVRLAYGVQQHTPEVLKSILSQQAKKQDILTDKITKIVQNHEEKLMKRLKDRKLRTMAAKSLSNTLRNNSNSNELSHRDVIFGDKPIQPGEYVIESSIQLNSRRQKNRTQRMYKSLEPQKSRNIWNQVESPLKRSISVNMAVHISKQNIKLWNFNGQA